MHPQLTGVPRLRRLLGAMALVSLALLASSVPAGAVVTTVGGQTYGVEPESSAAASKPTTPLTYEGGPVVHSNAPYAVYWDPKDAYAEWEGFTAGFLEKVGRASGALTNVYAVVTQYKDASGKPAYSSSFHGAYTDVDLFPTTENCSVGTTCLTDTQVQAELTKYIAANHLPTGLNPIEGPTPIYFMFTPPGVTVCLESGVSGHCSKTGTSAPLCSYHSYMSVEGATVLYAVQPWTVRSGCQNGSALQEPNKTEADAIVTQVASQQIASVTDPLLTGWHDTGGVENEVPDKCRNEFSPFAGPLGEEFNQTIESTQYYLNDEFNQAALYDPYPGIPCLTGVTVNPRFTAPNPVHSEDWVTFNATESYVDLGIAKYRWEFGDGTTAEVDCEGRTPTYHYAPAECSATSGIGSPNPVASVVHKYEYAGSYSVKLTVTDDGGNEASTTRFITVFGQARPVAEPPPPSGAGAAGLTAAAGSTGASSSSSTAAAGGSSAGAAAVPNPVAAEAVVSRSLRSVLRHGLVVRYSVNEQVAGHFEVLLNRALARHLGIAGVTATGLAAGTPAQVVIAKAILVTTAAGRSTVTIQFSKRTASRLARLHKVTLMVRLIVRNAASRTPATTTVFSTVTLSG